MVSNDSSPCSSVGKTKYGQIKVGMKDPWKAESGMTESMLAFVVSGLWPFPIKANFSLTYRGLTFDLLLFQTAHNLDHFLVMMDFTSQWS